MAQLTSRREANENRVACLINGETVEDLSTLSDEYLFDDFRALFTSGRQHGLTGEARTKYQEICAEMRKRGWLDGRKYGLD